MNQHLNHTNFTGTDFDEDFWSCTQSVNEQTGLSALKSVRTSCPAVMMGKTNHPINSTDNCDSNKNSSTTAATPVNETAAEVPGITTSTSKNDNEISFTPSHTHLQQKPQHQYYNFRRQKKTVDCHENTLDVMSLISKNITTNTTDTSRNRCCIRKVLSGEDDEMDCVGLRRQLGRQQVIDYVLDPVDKSILVDQNGIPVTVDRMLATKPLRQDLMTRPGPGGKKLLYMSGESITRTLNEIFGYDGWHLQILKTDQVVCEQQKDLKNASNSNGFRWCIAYMAHVRITHAKSGTYKEDVGAGDSIDRNLSTAIQHAMKASITDAMKRAARHFGDKLGNILCHSGFSINNAPKTIAEAFEQYNKDRRNNSITVTNTTPTTTTSSDTVVTDNIANRFSDYTAIGKDDTTGTVIHGNQSKNDVITQYGEGSKPHPLQISESSKSYERNSYDNNNIKNQITNHSNSTSVITKDISSAGTIQSVNTHHDNVSTCQAPQHSNSTIISFATDNNDENSIFEAMFPSSFSVPSCNNVNDASWLSEIGRPMTSCGRRSNITTGTKNNENFQRISPQNSFSCGVTTGNTISHDNSNIVDEVQNHAKWNDNSMVNNSDITPNDRKRPPVPVTIGPHHKKTFSSSSLYRHAQNQQLGADTECPTVITPRSNTVSTNTSITNSIHYNNNRYL